MDPWEARQAELLSLDDRAGFWYRLLYGPQDEPEHQGAEPVTDHAGWRQQLDLDHRGLDRGQCQQLGYRGVQVTRPAPGAEYSRAAQVLQHDMGPDARSEYAARQRQAAEQIYGFRTRQ
jgi:hypothetical protein